MAKHPLSNLDDEQRHSLFAFYREQEAAGNLTINSSDFHDGELLVINCKEQLNESTAPGDWDWRMEVARGCVLFAAPGATPEIAVRAMPKFHGCRHCPEAQQHLEADGAVTLMQKFDGSCISATLLLFTRGVRRNLQTQLARELLSAEAVAAFERMEGHTLAFELIHELDKKCEESRGPNRLVLLYACEAMGRVVPVTELAPIAGDLHVDCVRCEAVTGSEATRRVEALSRIATFEDLREGFVVEIAGRKYKVKAQLYQQLARSPTPRPTQAWLDKCFASAKSLAGVYDEVEKMQAAPLDSGALARMLLQQHLVRVDEQVERLRSLHASFHNPKEVGQSSTLTQSDKQLLFACVRLPLDQRDAWLDRVECRLKVVRGFAKRTE